MTKVMIIANDESTILNFRMEILKAFIEQKYQVFVCYPLGKHTEEIKQTGCEVIHIDVSRRGKNSIIQFYLEVFRKNRSTNCPTYSVNSFGTSFSTYRLRYNSDDECVY